MKRIELDDRKLRYCGRIDDSDPKRPEFIFPASFLAFAFHGTEAWAEVVNRNACWDNYLGVIVDGEQKKIALAKEGKTRFALAEGLERGRHEVMLFKRQDSCHEFILEKLETDGELEELPPEPERRMEVYGDSVSAGEVSEAVEYTGKPDPEHRGEYSNSWYSYSWITARKLNARLHDVAQGGIALLDRTGWFCAPDYVGMETAWDKLHYNPELGEAVEWDFSRYTPHVVIVAIGQNDSHPEDYMKEDPRGEKAEHWKASYEAWLRGIRQRYPRAMIILATTILEHDLSWDEAIREVCRRLNDPRMTYFPYTKTGRGTPGHIRIPEAEQMAEELSSFIETLPEEIWKD